MRAASRAAECGGTRRDDEGGGGRGRGGGSKQEQKCRRLSIYSYFFYYFKFGKKQLVIALATVFTAWGVFASPTLTKGKGFSGLHVALQQYWRLI